VGVEVAFVTFVNWAWVDKLASKTRREDEEKRTIDRVRDIGPPKEVAGE